MKVSQLKHLASEQVVELVVDELSAAEINTDDELRIYQLQGEFVVEQNSTIAIIEDASQLSSVGDMQHILWIPLSITRNKLTLQMIRCLPSQFDLESIGAAIDDKIVEQVGKQAKLPSPTIEYVSKWLEEEFVLTNQGKTKLLIATNREQSKQTRNLTLVGRKFLLQIELKADDTLWVKRLSPVNRNRNYELNLLPANLSFVDSTLAARINDSMIKEKLDDLQKNNALYIQLWDEYNQKVKEKAVDLAKQAKFVRFVRCEAEHSVDGVEWHFYYKEKDREALDALCNVLKEDNDSVLEVGGVLPGWLENNTDDDALAKDKQPQAIKAKYVRKTNQYIVLELLERGRPQEQGVIYLSISGSIVQMNRREKARDAISNCINPMPKLRFLIENIDLDFGRNSNHTLKPLTPSARNAFKGPPTDKQVEALDVALNTPDVALILGPPGTGKTQIISALQNRLAEQSGKNLTAEILLTSFQNDAVDNVVARSEAFGIPAIRADDSIRAPVLLEQWAKKQTKLLSDQVSHLSSTDGSYKIVKHVNADIASLLDDRVDVNVKKARFKSLLEDVEILRVEHGFDIPLENINKLEACYGLSESVGNIKQSHSILSRIRGLRTTRIAYNDDGVEQCWCCASALSRLDSYRSSEEVNFLNELGESFEPVSDQQLAKLREIKNELLDKFLPDCRPLVLQSQVSDEFKVLLNQLAQLIKKHAENCSAGIADVVEEYLDLIKYQPQLLQSCVAEYTTSVGASCQRSQSEKVSGYKQSVQASIDSVSNELTFDTVIIDEAARANPLDLFIPMALAKRRIVLVGDHFQLPQMLEPDIETEMTDAGSLREETADAIKKSLFERLYTQLKDREAKDGIQRTVMLDTQFRMHPKIGNFVSRSFYESEGESKIKAGLSEDEFNLGLDKYVGKVAEWVDVPLANGKERSSGTSWKRECEAEKVASEVIELLDASSDISIGVITFFASQRELIFEKLSAKGICRKSSDGWEYLPGYKTLSNGEERLRVGSVDAFQGKEFDVVVLSTVRSNDYPANDENSLRRKYGFIRTPNRLNVAFSRAKSLIKVVGDKAMFSSESARAAIPAVWSFVHELCEE